MAQPSRQILWLILGLALVSISSGSILVRLTEGVPALTLAFYRMAWASLLLTPLAMAWRLDPLVFRSGWTLLAGSSLALHFAFWIESLHHTSVVVSVLLVNTSPLLVAGLSVVLFREPLKTRGLLGILLTLGGGALLLWADFVQLGTLRGSLLALSGGVMLALYLICGRRLRRSRNLILYVFPTYLLAALFLGLLALLQGASLGGFPANTHLLLFLLGLVPQTVGHTAYNWTLKFLPATLISTLIVGEPIVAGWLAWWVLGEVPQGPIVLSSLVVAAGIFLVSTGLTAATQQPSKPSTAPTP